MPESLEAVVAGVLAVEPAELQADVPFDRLASWDSQRQVELAFAVERAYGVAFDDGEIERLDSLQAVRSLLRGHGVAEA